MSDPNTIEKAWARSVELISSGGVACDIAASLHSGVKSRYDRIGNQVLIKFQSPDSTKIMDQLKEAVGQRDAESVRYSLMDEEVVAQVPYQVFVNKLIGKAPNIMEQIRITEQIRRLVQGRLA